MQTITPSLSADERQTFSACEKIISAGLKTFSEVGNALLKVRDSQLYRESFPTFERYCREKWGMSDRRARQLCDAAEVVANLENRNNCSTPKSEAQVRPLTQLPPEQQSEAWSKAQEKAASEGEPVTAKHVQEAVDEIKPKALDGQFATAMGFESVDELSRPKLSKEDAANKAIGRIAEGADFVHSVMMWNYTPEEKLWILNHVEAALRHAKHDLEKHHKQTLTEKAA